MDGQLFQACQNGNSQIVKLLLQNKNCNINSINEGENALHFGKINSISINYFCIYLQSYLNKRLSLITLKSSSYY